jgi:hypothetical protein
MSKNNIKKLFLAIFLVGIMPKAHTDYKDYSTVAQGVGLTVAGCAVYWYCNTLILSVDKDMLEHHISSSQEYFDAYTSVNFGESFINSSIGNRPYYEKNYNWLKAVHKNFIWFQIDTERIISRWPYEQKLVQDALELLKINKPRIAQLEKSLQYLEKNKNLIDLYDLLREKANSYNRAPYKHNLWQALKNKNFKQVVSDCYTTSNWPLVEAEENLCACLLEFKAVLADLTLSPSGHPSEEYYVKDAQKEINEITKILNHIRTLPEYNDQLLKKKQAESKA